jgi:hypothetical protein
MALVLGAMAHCYAAPPSVARGCTHTFQGDLLAVLVGGSPMQKMLMRHRVVMHLLVGTSEFADT